MKKFMLLHFGFEKPTEEIMKAWQAWFAAVEHCSVEHGGFHGAAREISADGTSELPMGPGCITGYSVLNAESIDEAVALAEGNPFIDSIRVYEVT